MNPTHDTPAWRADFPLRQPDEHRVSRRQFMKTCGCAAATVSAGMMAKDKLFPPPEATEPKLIAQLSEVPIGGSRLFCYPTENHPCILVRLTEHDWAAYSQACTHLMCPVNYQHEKRRFYCPCHEGFFSAEDGRVLAGPPPKPLPRYPVEIRGGEVWVKPP